jgi:hypothetical protein
MGGSKTMKTLRNLLGKAYYIFFMMLLFSAPAYAYLDPGTVTYVVSMIAGLFIAGGAALAIFRRKIVLFFRNLGKKKDQTPGAEQGSTQDTMDDVVDPMADDQ